MSLRIHRERLPQVGARQLEIPKIPLHRRHSAGYKLAGDGHDTRSIQDYLGHKDIRHTVRYTALSPKPFRNFWRD
jgi:type 1 fimbriae regulatory protein FimE